MSGKSKPRTPAEICKEYLDTKEQAKSLYDKADRLLTELARATKGKPFQFSSSTIAAVKNNWRGETKCFAPSFARKFELDLKAGTLTPAP